MKFKIPNLAILETLLNEEVEFWIGVSGQNSLSIVALHNITLTEILVNIKKEMLWFKPDYS